MEEINKTPLNQSFHEFNFHGTNGIEKIKEVPFRKEEHPTEEPKRNNHTERAPLTVEKRKDNTPITMEYPLVNYISDHDLLDPLRKIQTFSSRILEKEEKNLSEAGKDYFFRMQRAAKRMQSIVNDLQSLSKINIDERKFIKTDIKVLLEEVKAELRESIERKKAVIKHEGLTEVSVIPEQMRLLLKNLLSNSVKFSKQNSKVEITIKGEVKIGSALNDRLSKRKKYFHFNISDNGIGFDPHFNESVFDVFQRLNGKDEYEGNGIGLAICKKIVENHLGVIQANGKPEEGANFDFYIPV
jgi:light-regulated signal transduction histidine kinase (bacteriophytochrome)